MNKLISLAFLVGGIVLIIYGVNATNQCKVAFFVAQTLAGEMNRDER